MQFHNKILIHKNNLISNFKEFKKVLPKTNLILVVKANAYGHGIKQITTILKSYEKEFAGYQVDDIQELYEIRKFTNKDIFVLGYVSKANLNDLIELNGIPVIYHEEQAQELNQKAKQKSKKIKIHICIDSYLGRDGVLFNKVDKFIESLLKYENIIIDGYYSHFANIEDTSDRTHANLQIKTFKSIKNIFYKYGLKKAKPHLAATSGILEYESKIQENFYARLGIGLYGLWPSNELRFKYQNKIKLSPVMEVKSIVADVKKVPKNYPIGYGLTYITPKSQKIAIIPFGYSDGIFRNISNKGHVIIKNHKCPIIGRVSMNMLTVLIDKTIENDVKIEDEVVLLGKQNNIEITAEEIADHCSTINYEIVTNFGNYNTPRIVIE